MTDRQRATLVAHGTMVFLLGLLAGFPFAFEILQRVELWPVPGAISFDPPGDLRGWRMAHLEGMLNGLVLFAVAGIAPVLHLDAGAARTVVVALLVTAWGNTVASIIGPLTETRGLAFGGFWNSTVYLLFVAAIIGIVTALVVILRAARARSD